MIAVYILGGLVLLIAGIMLLRVGADIYCGSGEELRLSLRAGPLTIRLGGEKKPRKKKKAPAPDEPAEPEEEKPKKRRALPPTALIVSLLQNGFEALCRLVASVRVDILTLHFTSAFPDPADTALIYAAAGTAMDGLLRVGGDHITVSDLRADVDFDAERPVFVLHIRATLRLGRIFRVVFRLGFGVLRDYIHLKRSEKNG